MYESLWIEININGIIYNIAGYYRHPNTSLTDFTNSLTTTLSKFKFKKCIIAGDLNTDLKKINTDINTKIFIDELTSLNFLPLSLLPTRVTPTSSTIIDHIFINDIDCLNGNVKAGVAVCDIADHLGNFSFILQDNQISHKENTKVRSFSKNNINKFKNCLNEISWHETYLNNNPNDSYNSFLKTLTVTFDKCFPLVKQSKKECIKKPWITPCLLKSINKKHQLYKKWIKNKKPKTLESFKTYASTLRKTLNKAEKDYYNNLFTDKSTSIKTMWKNLNHLCSYKNKSNNRSVDSIKTENGLNTNTNDISNIFNKYFCNVGINLAKTLPAALNQHFKNYLPPRNPQSMYFREITTEETFQLISLLPAKKSQGPDNISPFLLKHCKEYISEPLTHIFNLSISQEIYPEKLKLSKIIPLHKGGSRNELSNYRPISLTSSISKLFEKLIYTRIHDFINKYNLIYPYQFGFREHCSTTYALFEVVEMINQAVNNRQYIMGIFLDLKKAFDTVNIDILLQKLSHYGIRGNTLNLLTSFLNNRKTYTNVNEINSDYLLNSWGLPQGTVLAPLLFLIYINDMPNCIKNFALRLFADDSNVFITSNRLEELYTYGNQVLYQLYQWMLCNKLSLNLSKTNYIIFKPSDHINKYINNNKLTLTLNNSFVTRVYSVKYLGVIIDDQLNWQEHINNLTVKLNKFVGIFYKRKNLLPLQCRKNIYNCFILSNINYGIEVYGYTTKTILHPLDMACNKTLRALQYKSMYSNTKELYRNFNVLPVNKLFEFNTLKFMYKINFKSSCLPTVIRDLYTMNYTVHQYFTRSYNMCHSFVVEKFSPVTYSLKLWNNLPLHLKSNLSFSLFITNIKQYLLEQP